MGDPLRAFECSVLMCENITKLLKNSEYQFIRTRLISHFPIENCFDFISESLSKLADVSFIKEEQDEGKEARLVINLTRFYV